MSVETIQQGVLSGCGHPDPGALLRFFRGEASLAERRAIVRHLLAGCCACAGLTGRLWALGGLPLEAVEEPAAAPGRERHLRRPRRSRRGRRARMEGWER
jgi:hypothetical protein